MKNWNNPSIEELNVSETAYSVSGGTRMDGAYTSKDGKYNYPTYGPSGGANDGTPRLNGNDPSIGKQRTGDGFVGVD